MSQETFAALDASEERSDVLAASEDTFASLGASEELASTLEALSLIHISEPTRPY